MISGTMDKSLTTGAACLSIDTTNEMNGVRMSLFIRVTLCFQLGGMVVFAATESFGQTPVDIRFKLSEPGEVDAHYVVWKSPEGLEIGEVFYGQKLTVEGNASGNYSDEISGRPARTTGLAVLVMQDIYTEEASCPDCPNVKKEVFEEIHNFDLQPLSSKTDEVYGALRLRSRGYYRPLAGAGSFLLPVTCSKVEVHYDEANVGTIVRVVGFERCSQQTTEEEIFELNEQHGTCELNGIDNKGVRGFNWDPEGRGPRITMIRYWPEAE